MPWEDVSKVNLKLSFLLFKDKELTEEDALVNARLARILTVDDYDFENKKPKLWTPPPDYEICKT